MGVFSPAYDIDELGSRPTLHASEIEHFRHRLVGHRLYEFSLQVFLNGSNMPFSDCAMK